MFLVWPNCDIWNILCHGMRLFFNFFKFILSNNNEQNIGNYNNNYALKHEHLISVI